MDSEYFRAVYGCCIAEGVRGFDGQRHPAETLSRDQTAEDLIVRCPIAIPAMILKVYFQLPERITERRFRQR